MKQTVLKMPSGGKHGVRLSLTYSYMSGRNPSFPERDGLLGAAPSDPSGPWQREDDVGGGAGGGDAHDDEGRRGELLAASDGSSKPVAPSGNGTSCQRTP
ncbi:hypothetical protein ElyMa_003418800 [Elysia marginata]|uniref:Uncharacterized protein n=1 Tax=Elysia marginata TaxID=1093978 RepID=A0AAV4JQG1_9GAST|nr:hypothetical protein ElyMa_003418800 [Elysia marginata]